MKKLGSIIFIILFLAMLLIPFALTNRESEAVSEIDNRVLVEAPLFGSENYSSNFESWLQDRIGLRNEMVNGYAVINDRLSGELTHPLYTYGQEGYVFFNMHYNYPYSDYHKTFAEMVLKLQEYVESRGSSFYFMFEPEKSSVLRRFLPEGVNYDDSWVDEMLDYMDELGVHYVSNKELLTEKSYSEVVFNRQYDAGHWNELGCFYGTNNLLNLIHEDYPTVTELNKDEFDISTKTAQYLPVSQFVVNEEVPSFQLKASYENISAEYSPDIERDYRYQHFHYYINNAENADELPKTLIFQGSYYNSRNQFFVSRTSEDIGVHNYQNVLNLDYYFNIFQPEIVVFEVTEYTFANSYFDLIKMLNLDLNPAISASLVRKADRMDVDDTIYLQSGEYVDRVLVDHRFYDARYAYLITKDDIFDLEIDDSGYLYASIPHGAVKEGEELTVYLVNNDGKACHCEISVAESSKSSDYLRHSANAVVSGNNYTLTTDIDATLFNQGNVFSSVVLQLLNGENGNYIENICSSTEKNIIKGIYTHKYDDGWYRILLKANSNLKDEGVECLTYLKKGHGYFYSFSIDDLLAKKVELSNFIFFGGEQTTNLVDDYSLSAGAVEQAEVFTFTTDVEDNVFNSIVLQIYNNDTGEFYLNAYSTTTIGTHFGSYTHDFDSGIYKVRLKANSNLKDECVDYIVNLEKGKTYGFAFDVYGLEATSAEVGMLSFFDPGPLD